MLLTEAMASIRPQLDARGVSPGLFQASFRGLNLTTDRWTYPPILPDNPTSAETTLAVLDALINIGGIPAWNGDGVSCVAQMLDAIYRERNELREENVKLKETLANIYTASSNIKEPSND